MSKRFKFLDNLTKEKANRYFSYIAVLWLCLAIAWSMLFYGCKSKKIETVVIDTSPRIEIKDTFTLLSKLEVRYILDSIARTNPDYGFEESYKFVDSLPSNVSIPVITKIVTKYVQDETLRNKLIKEFESKRNELEFLNNLNKKEVEARKAEIEKERKSSERKTNIMFWCGVAMMAIGFLVAIYYIFKINSDKLKGFLNKLKFWK